jgi:hypothetical protein
MNVALIAAVVHEVLKTGSCDTLFDLAETVKCRCARLKVPYDAGGVTEALRLVARTRTLPGVKPIRRITPIERVEPFVPPSRTEAVAILARLYAQLEARDACG